MDKEKLLRLTQLKAKRDEANEAFKAADSEFKQFQQELWDEMDEQGIKSMNVDDVNYIRTSTAYGTIQDRDLFVDWANDNDESLVQQKERGALLNELVREKLDNEEELPPGVGYYTREVIQQRKG